MRADDRGPNPPPISDEIKVGDRVEVTTGRYTTGTVEKIVYRYRTAVLRLDSGGTLSATLRELRKLT